MQIHGGTGEVVQESVRNYQRSVSPIPKLDLVNIKSNAKGVNWFSEAQKMEESLRDLGEQHVKL
jgi:hypothetical protein